MTGNKIHTYFSAYPLKQYTKGDILIQAHHAPKGIFYLTEGRVNQYDISPSGTTVVVNIFKPPAFFPMSWAINQQPNGYFFEAATNVSAHLVPAKDAVAFLHTNPDITFDLLSRVYKGTDGLLRKLAHLMGGSAKTRLIYELLNASYRFGQPQPNGAIYIPLSESDVSRNSGLARETVSRLMQDLKTTKLVTVDRSGITLRNQADLEALIQDSL